MSVEVTKAKFEGEIEKMQKLQKQYQKLGQLNGQLDTQMNENQMVQEELNLARNDCKVYRKIGGVLIPQTLTEAQANVNRRMEYIKDELKRNADLVERTKSDLVTQREVLTALEGKLQKLQPKVGTSS